MNNMQSIRSFLASRRSTPPALLAAPFPTDAQIQEMAQMALRVPDHKKLEPWRLVVISGSKCGDLADIVALEATSYLDAPEKIAKITALYRNAGTIIALIHIPIDEPAVPDWEQLLSMGAVGISLVNAAISMGFGAYWATGFLPEATSVHHFLGMSGGEKLCGLVHLGTPSNTPPERPRPDIGNKLSWI